MTKIFKELYETKNDPILLFVKKEINMGDSSYYNFEINKDCFEIVNGELIIKDKQNVYARVAENNWLEVKFEDGTTLDVAFDEVEEYDEFFEIQGRPLSQQNRRILAEFIDSYEALDEMRDYNCLSCGEEYSSIDMNEMQDVEKCFCALCEEENRIMPLFEDEY